MNKLVIILVFCVVMIFVYPYLWYYNILTPLVPSGEEEPAIIILGSNSAPSNTVKIPISADASVNIRTPYLFGLYYLPVVVNNRLLRFHSDLLGINIDLHDIFLYSMCIISISLLIIILKTNKKR